jgi:hypothetical protein
MPVAPIGSLRGPVVIASGGKTGLEYWPLGPKGSRTPTEIAVKGLRSGNGIAADGQRIAIARADQTVVYDLVTQKKTILPNPSNYATDAAFGKTGVLYVANLHPGQASGNVLVYPPGGKPRTLECALLRDPAYIAVDNEGDVFINDLGLNAIVEIQSGAGDATRCFALTLNPGESGYGAGVTVDPKTDDLLVLDNPDLCAGGVEGRLTVYHKPYEKGTGKSMVLGTNCASGVRLNADSSVVLIGDGPPVSILQHTYPDGARLGSFVGGRPYGFTTIPNTLPN